MAAAPRTQAGQRAQPEVGHLGPVVPSLHERVWLAQAWDHSTPPPFWPLSTATHTRFPCQPPQQRAPSALLTPAGRAGAPDPAPQATGLRQAAKALRRRRPGCQPRPCPDPAQPCPLLPCPASHLVRPAPPRQCCLSRGRCRSRAAGDWRDLYDAARKQMLVKQDATAHKMRQLYASARRHGEKRTAAVRLAPEGVSLPWGDWSLPAQRPAGASRCRHRRRPHGH